MKETAARGDGIPQLDRMVDQELMMAALRNTKVERAAELFPRNDIPDIFAKHCKGATCVPIEEAINWELWLKSDRGSGAVNEDGRQVNTSNRGRKL
jgi:hypothetical protein